MLLGLGLFLGGIGEAYGQTQTITTTGPNSFTVPAGVTSITVEVWGGGGRGGSRTSNGAAGGGGGGAYSRSVITVTPGQIINYYVGFRSLTSAPGEDSWFSSNTTLMAKGGNSVGENITTGATGGSEADGFGDFKRSGGNGANAASGNGGGGGSSAGIASNGTNATNANGALAPTGGGNGGAGKLGGSGQNGQGRGEDGSSPGGGGGGGVRSNASGTEIVGGYGGNGQVRISYIALTSATGTDNQSVCNGDPIINTTYSIPIPASSVSPNLVISGLPAGLTSSYNGTTNTITISGTPTASGTYTISTRPTYLSSVPVTLIRTGSVTVNPRPAVNPMTTTVCSAESFTVTPVNGTNGVVPAGTTYSWLAPTVTGGMTGGAAGTGASSITGTLTNPTNTAQTATYTVTPTTGSCAGTPFTVTVTVNPKPALTNMTASVCTDAAFTVTPVNGTNGVVPAGTTYSWSAPTVTGGMTGGAAGSGANSITGTLTNPTNSPQTATYTVTPLAGTCTGTPFTVTVTVDPITDISSQPSTSMQVECFGDGFPSLSVSAVGGGLTYQWYRNSTNSNSGGIAIPGANSATFTPPSSSLGSTFYYVVVTGNCGIETSDVSGEFIVTPPITTITQNPSTTPQTVCFGDTFTALTVGAIGEGTVTFQWYKNTSPTNTGGTLIPGETNPSYTPLASAEGVTYYYATAASNCGTVPTEVSGAFTVTPLTEITAEDLDGEVICDGDTFDPISVTAEGTGAINYQWYRNTTNSTSGPNVTAVGTNSNSYTPLANAIGTYYYFVTVSSDCGPDQTSAVSGAFTVNPIPTVTNTVLTETICSGGSTTQVDLTSAVVGTTFSWTATATAGVTGFAASGSGPIPAQTISTTGTTQGTVTYVITPTANGCPGPTTSYTVLLDPLPTVTNSTLTQTVCSGGSTTLVNLTSAVAGTTFSWTATATPGVSGFTASGSGPIPTQTLSTTGTTQGTVTYVITPTANGCPGPTTNYTVLVNPIPTVTNSTLTQTVCSGGSTTLVNPTSAVAGTTFSWTASATAGVSGFTSSGSGPIPVQTISTTGTTQGSVTYVITPTANGCPGPTTSYTVLVDPLPTVTNATLTQTICSGGSTTLVNLNSAVVGTTFSWTATATPGVTGFAASGSGPIPTQTISTSGTTQGTVTYVITPTANGCPGPTTNYTVLVNPLATVGAPSVAYPSVCISNPSTLNFTQQTTGVTGIANNGVAGVNGLPPGISANFNSGTGVITFSGTATTTGLYTYNIPLTGNCINGLTATGTIDVTPNYQITSVSSVSATVAGGTASITINGNLPTLPNGTYEVTYILDDGINPPTEHTSSSFSVGNGRGTFSSIPLSLVNVDVYKLTIKSIRKITDVCTVNLNTNDPVNTTYFSVCGAPFNTNGTFYVPAGIYEISIQATGAGPTGQSNTITIPVTPGEPLGVFVGQGAAAGAGRNTWVTRDSSNPNPVTTSLIYVNGGGVGGPNGQVNISYTCPDPIDNDCLEVIDDGGISGTTIIRFTCDDTWEIPEGLIEFSVNAVGGGGGGGMGPTAGGGGGGGIASTTVISTSPYGIPGGNSLNIKVGDGGSGAGTVNVKGANGDTTTVTSIIPDPGGNININLNAFGGGGGGSFNNLNGANGASGGGGAYSDQTNDTPGLGGSSIPGQGNKGGNGGRGNQPNHARGGAGGGGAGSAGENGSGAGVGISKSGNGGDGSTFEIEGNPYGYGAGGGGIGFNFNGNPNTPGLGGEVDGVILGGTASDNGIGGNGTIYTGSGGGAGTLGGGRGGRGVVYISYFNFSILPIEYLYFNASYQEDQRAGKLAWATAKEYDNSHFEIERAVGDTKTWTKIGEVAGKGYSDSPVEYSFDDLELPAGGGNIFYRLKQVSLNGQYEYSVTRAIQVDPVDGSSTWVVYPNPSSSGSNVKVELIQKSGYREEPVQVMISDIRGIAEIYSGAKPEEVSNLVNNYLEKARPGVYILQLVWGDRTEQHKLLRR